MHCYIYYIIVQGEIQWASKTANELSIVAILLITNVCIPEKLHLFSILLNKGNSSNM